MAGKNGIMEWWNNGMMERLSKLVCENLIACSEHDSGSGLWERIMVEDWEDVKSIQRVISGW